MTLNKETLLAAIEAQRTTIIASTQKLVAAASPNPPGDVSLAADVALTLLQAIPGAMVTRYESAPGIVNLVARVSSGRAGRTLVFNGHLDTFPLGEDLGWTVPPLSGAVRDGRLYGRGVSDMKGGIVASIAAATAIAGCDAGWCGDIVLTLAGDEESMGKLGTQWLLDHVPEARGDAMISGDVGSPSVIRFGEKGLFWVDVTATGKPSHGAHVHKGINAIDRLRTALDALKRLEQLPLDAPDGIGAMISSAAPVSEALSGVGESDVLQRVTVNLGRIEGGVSPNLVPTQARAQADIRLPIGVDTATVTALLHEWLDPMQGVSWEVIQKYDPTFTSPEHEIVQLALQASQQIMARPAVANMRIGASDARLYRAAGVPTIVIGCTPHGMGGPDEHVVIDELVDVAKIHALIAARYLEVPHA